MREIMKIDSIPKALSFLTVAISLALIFYGIYEGSYWSGFGLILLAPSLLVITSSPRPQIEMPEEANNSKKNIPQNATYPLRREMLKHDPETPQLKEA